MTDYVTLSILPSLVFVQNVSIDPTIRSQKESGYVYTRSRFTRVPKNWEVTYNYLPTADKDLLQTFEDTTVSYGASSFEWTNPGDNVSYTVRFAAPITYNICNSIDNFWNVNYKLEEV